MWICLQNSLVNICPVHAMSLLKKTTSKIFHVVCEFVMSQSHQSNSVRRSVCPVIHNRGIPGTAACVWGWPGPACREVPSPFHHLVISVGDTSTLYVYLQICPPDWCCTVDLPWPLPPGGATVHGRQVWSQLSNLYDDPDLQDGPDVYVRSLPGEKQFCDFI